jgi:hypothetical protein
MEIDGIKGYSLVIIIEHTHQISIYDFPKALVKV